MTHKQLSDLIEAGPDVDEDYGWTCRLCRQHVRLVGEGEPVAFCSDCSIEVIEQIPAMVAEIARLAEENAAMRAAKP